MIFRRGKRLPGEQLKPNCYFYGLGLSPSIGQTIIESVLRAQCCVFMMCSEPVSSPHSGRGSHVQCS